MLQKSGTQFAIRGGGHNVNVGWNNIENGVTIDMRSMKAVSVGIGDEVVSVGAGAVWQDVYDVTDKRNISVLGGRIGVVGVAGFLTGGMSHSHFENSPINPSYQDTDQAQAAYRSSVLSEVGLVTTS